MTDVLRSNGMDVIDDVDVGQRVLDEARVSGKLQMGDTPETFAERQKQAVENRGVVMPGLDKVEVNVVKDIPRHGYTGSIAEATKQAIQRAKEKFAPEGKAKLLHYDNNGAKFYYTISGNAIEICLSPKHQAKSKNKGLHLALVEHLDEVIDKSIEVEEHPDYIKDKEGKRGEEINPNAIMHRFYGVAVIDDVPCRVMTLMREEKSSATSNDIHSYEVQKIEVLDNELPSTSNGVGSQNQLKEGSSYPLAKLIKNIEKSYDKGKYLLEESKKRDDVIREQKVYHGSQAEFDHFDHSHMGEGEGAQAYGWGTYVTEVEGIGRSYAEQNAVKHNNVPEYEEAYKNYSYAMSEYYSADTDYTRHLQKVDDLKELLHSSESNLENCQKQLEEAKQAGDLKRQEELERKIRMAMIVSDGTKRSISEESERMASLKERRDEALRKLDEAKVILDSVPAPERNLYTVEIPDDDGENYIDYNGRISGMPSQKIDAICAELEKLGWKRKDLPSMVRLTDGYDNIVINPNATGADLYEEIKTALKSDKKASLLLSRAGFVGIKYPADFRRGGRDDGKKNYVIFDEGNAKITDHVRFFRSGDGEAYGFTVGGKIYIDPRIANAETPVHEYAHLWASALRSGNPKEWRNVVELMKGTAVWDEVRKRYPELETDDEIADEVIATYSGRRGAERLREEAERIAGKDGDVLDKAEAMSALERVKRALAEFWKGVCDFLHIHYTSAEEVADRVMKDLLDGVNPRKYGGEVESRNVEKRMGMIPEERRASLAADTEDVSREDQIFLYGSEYANDESVSLFNDYVGKREEKKEVGTTIKDMKQRVIELFEKAKTGDFVGKPASIGRLSADGKSYLEKLSGLKFKEFVDFVLNPSDLNHIRSDHYGENEKDKGNNVPLTDEGIQNMVDVLNQPDGILYGVDKKDGRKLFFFLKDAGNGLYNLTEVCSTKKGNLTAKSFYKTKKKGISQRVMEIKDSLLPTSVTYSGEFLSSDAKIPTLFEINESSSKNIDDDKTKFRLLDDDDPKAMELEALPDSELVPVYRNVQAFEDDALGSPMAFIDAETGERRTLQGGKWNYSNPQSIKLTAEQQHKLDELNRNGYIMVNGRKSTELKISDGLKFVKGKNGEAQLSYWLKKNPEDSGVWAAYNPYDHAVETPLNTQFSTAYKRPNLVVVRSLMPKSELEGHYHADYAKDSTGAHLWNNGRTLYLSRWSKIDKVLTREAEAKLIDEYWKKNPGKRETSKVHRDYNHFVPQVRRELEKMGYRFELDGRELTPEESRARQ